MTALAAVETVGKRCNVLKASCVDGLETAADVGVASAIATLALASMVLSSAETADAAPAAGCRVSTSCASDSRRLASLAAFDLC